MTIHPPPTPDDVIALLQQNRASIRHLLDAYASLCDRRGDTQGEKLAVAERLNLELTLDTQIEEELLFPSLHAAGLNLGPFQALHDSAWGLVAQMSMGEPGDMRFDQRILSLGRDLAARMQQVHDESLPLWPGHGTDLRDLGARMVERKRHLMKTLGSPANEEDEDGDPVGGAGP